MDILSRYAPHTVLRFRSTNLRMEYNVGHGGIAMPFLTFILDITYSVFQPVFSAFAFWVFCICSLDPQLSQWGVEAYPNFRRCEKLRMLNLGDLIGQYGKTAGKNCICNSQTCASSVFRCTTQTAFAKIRDCECRKAWMKHGIRTYSVALPSFSSFGNRQKRSSYF